MTKLRLYLETSVWNFYYADDAPEKRDATHEFFTLVESGTLEIFISDIVIDEIKQALPAKRDKLLSLVERFDPIYVEVNEETVKLAGEYIQHGVLTDKSFEDATHAALATIHGMDALLSWNMKHLANLNKMQLINSVNSQNGYWKRLELITPAMVQKHED